MLFDEPERYFAPLSDAYYQQGDIVLAPVARLEVQRRELTGPADRQAELGCWVTRVLWETLGGTNQGTAGVVRAGYVPAMIVSHDCTLDKDFSRHVAELRRQQVPLAVAVQTAAEDLSLDRYFAVAPIVPFEDAAPSGERELVRNRVVGFFPVCDERELGWTEGSRISATAQRSTAIWFSIVLQF